MPRLLVACALAWGLATAASEPAESVAVTPPPAARVAPPPAASAAPASAASAAPAPAAISPSAPPTPPPLTVEYASYRALETGSGLDLSSPWRDYPKEAHPGESFAQYTRRRFRRRLFTGVGLSAAGLVVGGLGLALVLVSALADEPRDVDLVGGALFTAAGFSLAVPGGILWMTNQIRLHKLGRAGLTAGPRLLPGGAGLGVRLAF